MSYYIKSGTQVRIRSPHAKPTDWRSYQTRIDLRFVTPMLIDRGGYVFEHQGWRIRVRKSAVTQVRDAKLA